MLVGDTQPTHLVAGQQAYVLGGVHLPDLVGGAGFELGLRALGPLRAWGRKLSLVEPELPSARAGEGTLGVEGLESEQQAWGAPAGVLAAQEKAQFPQGGQEGGAGPAAARVVGGQRRGLGVLAEVGAQPADGTRGQVEAGSDVLGRQPLLGEVEEA
jgi:hypothetical protein